MPTLATIANALKDAEARRRRRIKDAELDYEREIAPWLAEQAPLLRAQHCEVADDLEWLTRSEVAALRPPGKARTEGAVRQAIDRACEIDPVTPDKRGSANTYPRTWLERHGIVSQNSAQSFSAVQSRQA